MAPILDQQFVAHVYAITDGPAADAARRAVREIWEGCGPLFEMTASIAGTGLSADFPGSAALSDAIAAGGEVALAARERPGTGCQAVLRVHHDILNMSVALVPPEASEPTLDGDWPWWRNLDFQWDLLVRPRAEGLLGEARLFLTRVDAAAAIGAADPALYDELDALLPAASDPHPDTAPVGVPFPGGFAIWEVHGAPDERATRRLVIPIVPAADPAASAWAWSASDTTIPPLARYLLHAAKVRYELRVWRRDSRARQLGESLDSLGGELRRSGSDPARQELLRRRRLDAVFLHADLVAMQRTVRIAADNLGRAFDLGGLAVPGSLFDDDTGLARWLIERLDDEAAYLAIAADRAAGLAELLPPGAPTPSAPASPAPASQSAVAGEQRQRNVFVVYGRDDPARRAVFDFLRALGLNPLDWEEIVRATGKNGPFLSEAVRVGLTMSVAVVVLLTPDDVVRLHPDLHEQRETAAETADSMQPRPNVLLELGMALAAKPESTLILIVGEQRQVTDLGGMSYVRLTGNPECRVRISNRLEGAGCQVKPVGTDWLWAGDFARLDAQYRRPDMGR